MALAMFMSLIQEKAKLHQVDPALLGAIVQVESGGDPWAVRYEATFSWISNPARHAANNRTTVETEIQLQRFSYGLCQIMGGKLRDMGFQAELPLAFDPSMNLEYGAELLQRLTASYPVLQDAISAYNAGSPIKNTDGSYINQVYVDKVTEAIGSLTVGQSVNRL